ncbi:MAG: hypothetical protein Tsb0014_40060 [Pleurocapsa sp.]
MSSSKECIELLAERAIANSPELVTLDEQIALIDKRLVVADKRIDHTSKKRWTNYISSDPLGIAANILGGGDVQRDNIAIAFALVSGIKDIRALVTTSMSAGSIAFVVSALGNSKQ